MVETVIATANESVTGTEIVTATVNLLEIAIDMTTITVDVIRNPIDTISASDNALFARKSSRQPIRLHV